VRYWVGVTDSDWFDYLRGRSPDEVNFWQPSADRRAVRLDAGALFLFKLHSPRNFIVGGGFYVRYSALPARLAWEAFGEKNGTPSYAVLRWRVERYRRTPISGDPFIGCNVLNAPFFLEQRDWIPIPETWAPNTQQGRTFDTETNDGLSLWNAVQECLRRTPTSENQVESPRFGEEYLTRARLGQGAFRVLVTEAYDRRCAISGERTLPVLEAAHIKPYAKSGPHVIPNGVLLRSDLHILFDDGYLTVTEDLTVKISRNIKNRFENGHEYYRYQDKRLEIVPDALGQRPSPEFLHWHNTIVFQD
jgi:putative restriction endonuclease